MPLGSGFFAAASFSAPPVIAADVSTIDAASTHARVLMVLLLLSGCLGTYLDYHTSCQEYRTCARRGPSRSPPEWLRAIDPALGPLDHRRPDRPLVELARAV